MSTRVPPRAAILIVARNPPSVVAVWLLGSALLWLLYAGVFVITAREGPSPAALDALANVLPLALLAVAVRAVLKTEVMRRSTPVQAAWHGALGIGFAFTWYAALIMLLAILSGLRGGGFTLVGFSGPALTWQVFQGLLIYAVIAATCYAVRGGREAASVTMIPTAALTGPPPLTRYLIRSGDELTPVAVEDIVTITGAQDYAEVSTLAGRHLVRMSLAELEARLDGRDFVRVHRSAIINFQRLARLEPAGGGRLIAHMANGEAVPVSRSGAQTLRGFVV